jgi:hypothetical protein
MHLTGRGVEPAGFVRIGEKRDRFAGIHQHDLFDVGESGKAVIDRVGDAVDRHAPMAAGDARGGAFGQQPRPAMLRDAPGFQQRRLVQASAAHQQQGRQAVG